MRGAAASRRAESTGVETDSTMSGEKPASSSSLNAVA
jgi:hypothetical protein